MGGSGWLVACRSWLQCSQRNSFPLYCEPAKYHISTAVPISIRVHIAMTAIGRLGTSSQWWGHLALDAGSHCSQGYSPMADKSQTSQVTAQSRFYCICLNRIPRAGELSPQHRKYPRHRSLHLILNCSLVFFTSV